GACSMLQEEGLGMTDERATMSSARILGREPGQGSSNLTHCGDPLRPEEELRMKIVFAGADRSPRKHVSNRRGSEACNVKSKDSILPCTEGFRGSRGLPEPCLSHE